MHQYISPRNRNYRGGCTVYKYFVPGWSDFAQFGTSGKNAQREHRSEAGLLCFFFLSKPFRWFYLFCDAATADGIRTANILIGGYEPSVVPRVSGQPL